VIALALLTFASGRLGGSETYTRGLLAALRDHGTFDYLAVLPPDEVEAAACVPVVAAGAAGSRRRPVVVARAALASGVLAGADIVHYPLTVDLPRTSARSVVTLHDTLHHDLPALLPRATRLFRKLAYDSAARRADRVIVPSEFVRERAVRRLGLDESRVCVVHHAVDVSVFWPDDREREAFLLYPARAWPHKNHALLFQAFTQIREELPDLELVLTGGGHSFSTLPDGVRSVGHVELSQLAELYRRAAAVVFPSRYEGFGLPVLEAMASGCSVVAIRGTAAEEIADGAAVTFVKRQAHADALAEGIREALAPDPARVQRGVEIAAEHSWQRVAECHDEVYRELL
jgi:glycosyltransferase involved in cell wall biosynthesis